MKPLIGITTSHRSRSHQRMDSHLLGEYAKAVASTGGLPVLIPNEFSLTELPALLDRLDGVLLSGGGDINPALYSTRDDGWSKNRSELRDSLEKVLVAHAVKDDLPLLGICRGCQMLNAALGGTLYTDIASQFNTRIVHDQPDAKDPGYLVHDVEILPGTSLAGITGLTSLRVNSRHHQAIMELAPGLRVTARAKDGLIEGVELPEKKFCIGVQWHPETLVKIEHHFSIFKAFIAAAQR